MIPITSPASMADRLPRCLVCSGCLHGTACFRWPPLRNDSSPAAGNSGLSPASGDPRVSRAAGEDCTRTASESVDVLVKLAGVQTKAFGGSICADASGLVRLYMTVEDLDRLASMVEMASRARGEDLEPKRWQCIECGKVSE